MKLYDLLTEYQDEEITVWDKTYDIEVYFYGGEIEKAEDLWDRSMLKLAQKLEVIKSEPLNNGLCATVNLSDLIENNLERLKKTDLLISYDIDEIMDDIERILAGGVSEEWLSKFTDTLKTSDEIMREQIEDKLYEAFVNSYESPNNYFTVYMDSDNGVPYVYEAVDPNTVPISVVDGNDFEIYRFHQGGSIEDLDVEFLSNLESCLNDEEAAKYDKWYKQRSLEDEDFGDDEYYTEKEKIEWLKENTEAYNIWRKSFIDNSWDAWSDAPKGYGEVDEIVDDALETLEKIENNESNDYEQEL